MTLTPSSIRWPLLALDFESSGLGRLTYPIEIGLASWKAPDAPIVVWSSLIRPTADWLAKGLWSDKSFGIHGIARSQLDGAPGVVEVLAAANRLARVGAAAFCDGGGHDGYWLNRLETAAGGIAFFHLASLATFRKAMSDEQRERLDVHGLGADAHRAAVDAVDHLKAIAYAISLQEPIVRTAPFDAASLD